MKKKPAKKKPAPIESLAVIPAPTDRGVGMFERLAKDPTVPVEKLAKLIELQERITAHDAKAEFTAAFALMQGEIPVIGKNGKVAYKDTAYSFATLPDIQRVVRPIMERHGFALRHRNEYVSDGKLLKITGILSHRSGHSEQDEFVCSADTSGSKNAIQAIGSARTYGQRYTTLALLNVSTEDQSSDDDSQARPPAPRSARPRRRETVNTVTGEVLPVDTPIPPAGRDGHEDEVITDFIRGKGEQRKVGQVQRLWVIIRRTGRSDEEIKAWLAVAYNIDSTKKIKRRHYEEICRFIEASGPLPQPSSREPGEDG